MKLADTIKLHTPATKRVINAGGPGSGDLPQIQREIAQRMANHLKVVSVHRPTPGRFSPTPKLSTPAKVGHSGPAPGGGPKMTKSAPRTGGRIGAGGPGSGRHASFGDVRRTIKQKGFNEDKGKFQNTTTGQGGGGRRYHYNHSDGSFYKVTHKVDDSGAPKEVGAWMYRGTGGPAKGKDGESLIQHLAKR